MPQPRKPRQEPQKSAKSRKSEAAKAVVLARSAAGASNSQIAREMGIDRETVSRILSEPEIAAVIQQGKNDVVRMVPKAVGVVDDALDKKNAKVAMGVLTGVGVLKPDGGYSGSGITLNITMDPRPRAVHIPTIPRRDETLIIQDSQPEQRQRELGQGTAPPKEIQKPFEEPESEERSRANYLQGLRDVARADERDRPPTPTWARR